MAGHYFEITDKETNTQGNFKVIKHLFHCQKDTTANHYHISIDIHNVSEICGSRHCMSIKIQSTHMVSTLFIILLDFDQHVLMRLHVDQLLCLSTGKKNQSDPWSYNADRQTGPNSSLFYQAVACVQLSSSV